MAMMMMEERLRTRSEEATMDHGKFYHVLQKVREIDRHYGEHEITMSDWDPSNDRKRSSSSFCETPNSNRRSPISESKSPNICKFRKPHVFDCFFFKRSLPPE